MITRTAEVILELMNGKTAIVSGSDDFDEYEWSYMTSGDKRYWADQHLAYFSENNGVAAKEWRVKNARG